MLHTTNTEILADRKVPSYLDLGLVGLKLARESLTQLTARLQTLLPSAVGMQGWEGAGLKQASPAFLDSMLPLKWGESVAAPALAG